MRLLDPGKNADYVPPRFFNFRAEDGGMVQVVWERAWPPSIDPPEDEAPGYSPLWRVVYRHNGQDFAVEWCGPDTDPGSAEAFLRMHAIIANHEPERPLPPPRRGLLYHVVAGVRAWLDYGT